MHSFTFAPGPVQKNHFPASFKTVWSIYTVNWWNLHLVLLKLRIFLSFCTNAKVFRPTNKLQNEMFCGNSFPNCTALGMNMYTSSKVTHAKYAVAETRIPGVKWITVIPVLRNL